MDRAVMQLLDHIRANALAVLYKAAEGLALLDVLAALTNCCMRLPYGRKRRSTRD
jgi:hypothetical protein